MMMTMILAVELLVINAKMMKPDSSITLAAKTHH